MLRKTAYCSFPGGTLQVVKIKMLNWITQFGIFAYLDNNLYGNKPNRFELLAGAGSIKEFDELPDRAGDWIFGHVNYDYKNVTEPGLHSRHEKNTGFSDSFFYQPEVVAYIPFGTNCLYVSVVSGNAEDILNEIMQASPERDTSFVPHEQPWNYKFTKEEYIDIIDKLREHIADGDCYEINFCVEAYTKQPGINAAHVFNRLNSVNPAPFAACYRNRSSWLMCASPERFLYRDKDNVLSQPIKGTHKRSARTEEDFLLKQELLHDEKERAENVMIVDLVRNDLARSCVPGSITVPELFGLYSFPQVHQLISTVSGTLKPQLSNKEILNNAFPMGSMTGAPKVMVMTLIEKYERSRREIYSGAVGYITPEGDFDFNVVIRSLMYNEQTGYLSYQTGGAITYDSRPDAEWEEVRLKAKAMEQIFK